MDRDVPPATLTREQFDTVLRRLAYLQNFKVVTIEEWDWMKTAVDEYNRLRNALRSRGIPEEPLKILATGTWTPTIPFQLNQASVSNPVSRPSNTIKQLTRSWAEAAEFKPYGDYQPLRKSDDAETQVSSMFEQAESTAEDSSPSYVDSQDELASDWGKPETPATLMSDQEFRDNDERRSIVFKGISQNTTLQDVANIVRGGMILNMFYMRHSVHVQFVKPSAAEAFVRYTKRNDIYIQNKRVDISWDERQSKFRLSHHLANRIFRGNATRNLLIHNAKVDMTVESIREDLEHIYRLEVLKITIRRNDILVSLNSVKHAISAKSCMLSRFKYRNIRIDFAPDECDEPLPDPRPVTIPAPQATSTPALPVNRFQLLALDEDEDENDDEEFSDKDSIELQECEKSMGRWVEATFAL